MFSNSVFCCFMPLIIFWEVQKILISRLPLLFGIICWTTWILGRKSLFMPASWSLLLPFSSRRLSIKPNVDISDPFGIDFLCEISNRINFHSSTCKYPVFSKPIAMEVIFSSLYNFGIFVKIKWLQSHDLESGSSSIFQLMCMCVWVCACVCLCVPLCAHTCVRVCACVCLHVYVCVHACACVYVSAILFLLLLLCSIICYKIVWNICHWVYFCSGLLWLSRNYCASV